MILQGDIPSNVDLPSGCRFHTRCPFVQEKCKAESPELVELEPGHQVACFYPVKHEKTPLIQELSINDNRQESEASRAIDLV